MNLAGMQVRSVKEGAVIPRSGDVWRYSIVVNGVCIESEEDVYTASDARSYMRDNVLELRLKHNLIESE